jgi:WhiB family transcriptional regulator, redox-sensing transcriptional regulator
VLPLVDEAIGAIVDSERLSAPFSARDRLTGDMNPDLLNEAEEDGLNTSGQLRSTADLTWADDGACRGAGDLFFPPFAERPQSRVKREAAARTICAGCSVQSQCRTYGRINREYGIWGGENEEERVLAGYALHAPIGIRHLAKLRREQGALSMPLTEMTDPSCQDLHDVDGWMNNLESLPKRSMRSGSTLAPRRPVETYDRQLCG